MIKSILHNDLSKTHFSISNDKLNDNYINTETGEELSLRFSTIHDIEYLEVNFFKSITKLNIVPLYSGLFVGAGGENKKDLLIYVLNEFKKSKCATNWAIRMLDHHIFKLEKAL